MLKVIISITKYYRY